MRHTLNTHRRRLRKLRRLNAIWMHRLAGNQRTRSLNQVLGITLASIAGMMNAGGFLVLKQYTSHMTGTISLIADMAFLAQWSFVFFGLGVVLFFILGSAFSTITVLLGRYYERHSEYAFPLILEAILLIVFSFLGFLKHYNVELLLLPLTFLLSFIMGMQNAIITKLSNAEVRTTHVTGTVTDIGIGLGRWIFSRSPTFAELSGFSLSRLLFQCGLVSAFFLGGVIGAWGFSTIGFYFCSLPVALLLWLSSRPVWKDFHLRRKRNLQTMG